MHHVISHHPVMFRVNRTCGIGNITFISHETAIMWSKNDVTLCVVIHCHKPIGCHLLEFGSHELSRHSVLNLSRDLLCLMIIAGDDPFSLFSLPQATNLSSLVATRLVEMEITFSGCYVTCVCTWWTSYVT